MYFSEKLSIPSSHCRQCHLRTDCCLCIYTQHLKTPFHFHLVVHTKELERKTNTGHLLVNALNAKFYQWERKKSLSIYERHNTDTFLLYPSEENYSTDRTPSPGDHIVILDGTWQETAKMLKQTPELRVLPRLNLQDVQQTEFNLRRNPKGLCTAEAGIHLLNQLGETKNAQKLHAYFIRFLKHFQASNSGHALHE